ncbi:hypothetical protein OF83DRAFT_1069520 [Amylostereum chailletii]|nr:hypothetical protein OF83DRAFT_1069520 [Amylostereum chailletii]
MSEPVSFPLSPFENKARIHAHIAFFAFMVALPLGIGAARYLRTFTDSWFWPHFIVNFFVTGPLVFTAFALGYQTTQAGFTPHFSDPHQKGGLALLILYLVQVFLGAFIHWVKLPIRFPGGRPPQNYVHIVLGLTIIGLASWQTHYGLWTEWAFATGNAHPVTWHCKDFWLAIVIVSLPSRSSGPHLSLTTRQIVWSLYGLGLFLLPRQLKQEAARRKFVLENSKLDGKGSKDDVPLM